MKAMRFHEFGDANVLRYEEIEEPTPGTGEVRIRVAATTFNGVDAGIRGGYLQGPFPVALPHTPASTLPAQSTQSAKEWAMSRLETGSSPSCPSRPTARLRSMSLRRPKFLHQRRRASR